MKDKLTLDLCSHSMISLIRDYLGEKENFAGTLQGRHCDELEPEAFDDINSVYEALIEEAVECFIHLYCINHSIRAEDIPEEVLSNFNSVSTVEELIKEYCEPRKVVICRESIC